VHDTAQTAPRPWGVGAPAPCMGGLHWERTHWQDPADVSDPGRGTGLEGGCPVEAESRRDGGRPITQGPGGRYRVDRRNARRHRAHAKRRPYKPSAIRAYDEALRVHILPAVGALRLSEVKRKHVQGIADRLHAAGKSPSTIRNAVMPLRVIYRRAIRADEITATPCVNLDLPAVRGRRDRVPSPIEAAALISALPESDRALWATALYAGLRRGELRALQWDDVDLVAGVIRVRRSMDARGSIIAPKSAAGTRTVPIAKVLRAHLAAHRLRNRSSRYVFGTGHRAFTPTSVTKRARAAWLATQLKPIGLHDARHAAASVLIAAGVNVKALSTYMGHASITVTLDRYSHLFPGNEDEAAGLVDAYLERAGAAVPDLGPNV
jgi:integrase